LGDTVSDASGTFALDFSPDKEGTYTIIAYFDGSASYYGSWAQNSMVVTTAADQQNYNTLMYGLYVIGIVLIIVLIVAVLLIIRKK
jgi:uncharacterized membrane protein YidH (DUF202 family)